MDKLIKRRLLIEKNNRKYRKEDYKEHILNMPIKIVDISMGKPVVKSAIVFWTFEFSSTIEPEI